MKVLKNLKEKFYFLKIADLEKIRDEKAKVIIFKNLEKQYPNILTIIKKMVCNKPAERIELIEISKLLENHADKIVEIDEIEYLKEYEVTIVSK